MPRPRLPREWEGHAYSKPCVGPTKGQTFVSLRSDSCRWCTFSKRPQSLSSSRCHRLAMSRHKNHLQPNADSTARSECELHPHSFESGQASGLVEPLSTRAVRLTSSGIRHRRHPNYWNCTTPLGPEVRNHTIKLERPSCGTLLMRPLPTVETVPSMSAPARKA